MSKSVAKTKPRKGGHKWSLFGWAAHTRVPEHGLAVVGKMIDELDAGHRFAEQPEEFSLRSISGSFAQVFSLGKMIAIGL